MFLIFVVFSIMMTHELNAADTFENARKKMVQEQLMSRGITSSSVLEAMRKIPRHEFVAEEFRPNAYDDGPLPIGSRQTISQPYIVAFMTQVLNLKRTDRVLEIGTGCGYQTAVLGELVQEVYSIEIIPELAAVAKKTLERLGLKNIKTKTGNGYEGWPEHAPFDAIIVTAAPEEIPKPLIQQLGKNGRMIVPVGKGEQDLLLLTKTDQGMTQKHLLPVRFVPMTGK